MPNFVLTGVVLDAPDPRILGAFHAEDCGATLAGFQSEEGVRVYLDPVGHPFCLFVS